MTMTTFLGRAAAAVVAAGAIATTADAGLLPISVSVTPEAGNYRWTYAIVLPTDMKLQSGNFFTVYDFDGLISDSAMAPEGWSFSTAKVGPTPDRLDPKDDVAVDNLTWTYNGPTIESGQIGLGNFMASSAFSAQSDSFLTAKTNRSSDGLEDRNITATIAPTGLTSPPPPPPPPLPPTPGVPEPGTLILAALGLPAAARFLRRKS